MFLVLKWQKKKKQKDSRKTYYSVAHSVAKPEGIVEYPWAESDLLTNQCADNNIIISIIRLLKTQQLLHCFDRRVRRVYTITLYSTHCYMSKH